MILSELKRYLEERKRASMDDIINRFDIEPDAAQGMLQHWQRKGRVRRIDDTTACGSCGHCADGGPAVFEWIG